MCFGKALGCSAMRALSYCGRNIHSEYFAQFTGSSIAVKVVVGM
jgi:hypothetical protein